MDLAAYDAGGAEDRARALDALDGSRTWPLLVTQQEAGGFSEVLWMLAGDLRSGRTGAQLRASVC